MKTARDAGATVGVATALALASGFVLLFADPGGAAWTSAAVVAGVACLVFGRLMTGGPDHQAERIVWDRSAAAAYAVALGLFAEAAVRVAVREGAVGESWEGLAFSAAAIVFSTLLFQGLVSWNQFRTDDNDAGDWLNGVSAVLATVAVLGLVLRVVDAPMASWAGSGMDIWLSHVVVLNTLAGSAWLAGSLGGRAGDRRISAVGGVLGAASVLYFALGFAGERAVDLGIMAIWIVTICTLGVCSQLAAVPVRAPSGTSQAQVSGALFVLGICVVVFVMNTAVGGDRLSTTLYAAAAALGSGLRLLQLVAAPG